MAEGAAIKGTLSSWLLPWNADTGTLSCFPEHAVKAAVQELEGPEVGGFKGWLVEPKLHVVLLGAGSEDESFLKSCTYMAHKRCKRSCMHHRNTVEAYIHHYRKSALKASIWHCPGEKVLCRPVFGTLLCTRAHYLASHVSAVHAVIRTGGTALVKKCSAGLWSHFECT